ncbi:MAG: glycine cleavage system aminomethyltransferase GcvT [Pseudomonadota bacterium]
MIKQTPLYNEHVSLDGKIVDFAGWQMPVNYGSQIAEHHAVRTAAGMFDVSHMTVIDVEGPAALAFLQRVMANDCAKLDVADVLYGALLNPQGGVIDDLTVYRLPSAYRCVVNASTRDKVLDWFARQQMANMTFAEQPLAIIAVQGPEAVVLASRALQLPELVQLKPFTAMLQDERLIGRTGYTGEDGVELIVPAEQSQLLWRDLLALGVQPVGLGARDTLRLEAGLNLYGQDLDEQTSPLASRIGWTIAWEPEERDFIGRSAVAAQRGAHPQKLTGLIMHEKGVLRHGQVVRTDAGEGVITSGSFSPTLGCSIALARLPKAASGACQVDIRGKLKAAKIVQPPFVRHGKILVE